MMVVCKASGALIHLVDGAERGLLAADASLPGGDGLAHPTPRLRQ